jgi:phospholipid-translocating ATPase
MEAIRQKKDCCMVIDGQSLETCLRHNEISFMDVAVQLPAVFACRCSPTQKAEITRLIATYTGRRTCAIGDGGDDVSMI